MTASLISFFHLSHRSASMAAIEENFPRGGVQKKPTEGKTPNPKLERDNLFDVCLHVFD